MKPRSDREIEIVQSTTRLEMSVDHLVVRLEIRVLGAEASDVPSVVRVAYEDDSPIPHKVEFRIERIRLEHSVEWLCGSIESGGWRDEILDDATGVGRVVGVRNPPDEMTKEPRQQQGSSLISRVPT